MQIFSKNTALTNIDNEWPNPLRSSPFKYLIKKWKMYQCSKYKQN